MEYKKIIDQILGLPWQRLDTNGLFRLMQASYCSAIEFADSLRITQQLYPDHARITEMVSGELKTNNLQFGEYKNKVGDHWEFLGFFLQQVALSSPQGLLACHKYTNDVTSMSPEVRAMTIFSREAELPGIFQKILENLNWQLKDLPMSLKAFQYYLMRHVELDSAEGVGHANLIVEFPIDDSVLLFYKARLQLYQDFVFRNN